MRKTKKQRFRASILAFLLIASMVLGMVPGSAGQVYAKESTSSPSEEEPGLIDKAVDFFQNTGDMIVSFFGAGGEAEPAAAYDESKVVDPETYATWEGIAGATTEHVGRIWTDKTVTTKDVTLPGGATPQGTIGDSDFLVMLSALSSTSNLVSTSSKPLDIVMVLDVSGSMANGTMRQEAFYKETYNINTDVLNVLIGPSYYALVDGKYVEIEPDIKWGVPSYVKSWKLNGQTVVPKKNASDTNGIQFYTREERTITYMQALQEAANSFVEATAAENDTIGKAEDQHRISVVKFADDSYKYEYGNNFTGEHYNYMQRLNALTAYNSKNVSELTDKISALQAAGGTAADFGMNMAQREFTNNGRADAQKVVIFFTDGEPNHGKGFESDVAKDAIGTAKTMKDAGALVYTIGVFSGADENDMSSNTNRYMQAMSSNYPTATGYQGDEIGDKTTEEGAAYYKAASDADTLNSIFDTIFDQITTGSGAPTQIEEGKDQNNSGYVTFTDQLGAYMQVDGFREVIFADQTFKNPTVTTDDTKGITTYKYSGAVAADEIYPAGDMADLMIEVKKGTSLAEGDTVTVKVPARMLPLRNFQATNVNGQITMQKPLAYPIRIFYGVSLKPAVETTLANGLGTTDEEKDTDTALEAYIKNNTTNGKTAFYSNNYDGTKISGDKKLGNTTATFVPSTKNTFYYFTSDTLLYEDIECTQPLKLKKGEEAPEGEIYYYKRSYVETTDEGTGASEMKTKTYAFNSENLNLILNSQSNAWEVNAEGQVYLVAGTPRLTRVDATTSSKSENTTGTATEVINPLWDNPAAPNAVNVYLGNNGKLSKELPGALVITKDARVAANKDLDVNVTKDKDFTFHVHVDGVSGNRWAEVKNAQGNVVKKAFEIAFNKQGDCTTSITLQDDQTLYIYGLNKDAQYQVTESEVMPAGFQLVEVNGNKVTEAAESKAATGTIKAGQKETVKFTNEYDVASTTVKGTDFAKYKKAWKENDKRWDVAESFNFYLFADHMNNPMPEGAQETQIQGVTAKVKKVTVNKDSFTGDFGEVTFTKPGTYTYSIIEETPVPTVAGMSYSGADYTVTVTVTDQGDGTLKAEAVMTKVSGDDGITLAKGEEVADKTAIFTNAFSAQSVSDGPRAQKVYTDKSGAKPLTDGMFQFKIKAVGSNAQEAPFPANSQADNEGWHTMTNTGSIIQFGQAAFTEDHVNQTFTYEFKEVMPAEANADNQYTVNGMTYDPTIYTVEFAVTHEAIQSDKNEAARVKVTKTYYKGTGENKVRITDQEVVFSNQYDPADLVIPSNIADALTGSKILNGRDTKEGEAFTFTLSAADQATKDALTKDVLVFQGDTNLDKSEISVTDLKNNNAKDFQFGEVRITQPGTYCFNVVENAPADDLGMTYDGHTAHVTVKVKDNNGRLELDGPVTYNNGEGKATDKAEFVNTYRANTGYGTDMSLQIGKTLQGRPLESGEFTFAISGIQTANSVTKEEADQKLSPTDKNFTNTQRADAGVESLIVDKMSGVAFDQNDAGKTFCYQIEEVKPENALPGVTYSTEKWVLEITVHDNADGTMYTTSKVSRSGDESNVTEYNGKDGSDTAKVTFTNAYTTGGTEVDTDPTDKVAYFNKKLVGRDWLDTDEFTFTITPQNDAPAPEKTTATVKKADDKAGDEVPFGFGKITFTDEDMAGATANEDGTLSKTFTYQITENEVNAEAMPGVTKDNHVATLTITVTDNQKGQLSTTAGVTVSNGTFTNTYESSLDYTALSGLQITKVLHGRDMEAGQFTFTVTPEVKNSAKKLGLEEGANEFKNTAKPAGGVDTIDVLTGKNVTFTQADAGKTFAYTVKEIAGDNKAYTYDNTPRTVTIEVKDNKNATLTVTTTVKKGSEVVDTQIVTTGDKGQKKATVAFVNTYSVKPETLGGDGEVKINAKKTLTNRPMVADEFKFHVKDNKNETVTSGTNSADGTITFAPVTYDTDTLIKDAKEGIAAKSVKEGAYVYTYDYKVVEDDSNFADGVTGIHTSHPITVIVTDDGKGNLSIEVVYPEGSENVLTFKNIYGADESAVLNINGRKTLKVESGTNAPDITGKYTFTIEGSEGAPMPEKTKATNDAAGNVDFGTIQYTMENVFGSEPAPLAVDNTETDETGAEPTDESDKIMPVKSEERTKEFTYTVKESGNVAGVDNDKKSEKTFKVTVTDNGDGTIAVDGPKEFAFEFTNTYSVAPVGYSINTDLTINKELDGRELREGEFTFELVSEDGKVVSTATNSADGSVAFKAITYKTPGTYNYVIREQKGSAGGVEYDSAEHTVVVVVTDNGDGTMTAKAELKSRDDEDAKNAIVFKNSYTAQPASVTLGASKAYTGGKLGDGQFTFELRDESDKLISKAKNNENGQIVFETIEYKNVGTYKYKISEVNDEQKHVTYDKTVYGVTVTVTDNQEGSLMAAVEYDGGKAPVFTNKYSKPAKPAKPEEPKGPTAVKTGDETPVIPFIILMVATLAIIVTITFIFFRRKRR